MLISLRYSLKNTHATRLAHTHGCKRQTPLESTGILFWIDWFTFIWDFIRLWSEIFMAVCVRACVSGFQCDQSRFINLTAGTFKGHFPITNIKTFHFHLLAAIDVWPLIVVQQYIQSQSNIVCSAWQVHFWHFQRQTLLFFLIQFLDKNIF